MRLDISIREKLVIYFVALGICSILVVVFYSYQTTKQAILDRSFEQLTSVREVKKGMLENFFSDRIREIELISHSEEIQQFLQTEQSASAFVGNNPHFGDFLKLGRYYSTLMIVNETSHFYSSKILHSPLEFSTEATHSIADSLCKLVRKSGMIHLTDYYLSGGEAFQFLSAPVYSADSLFYGAIVLSIPLEAVNRIMLEKDSRRGLGESGESYLVGADLLMRSTSRFGINSVMRTQVNTLAVNTAFSEGPMTEIVTDYRGISVLSSFSRLNIGGLDWVILAEIDFKEVLIPVFTIRNRIILLAGAVSLGMLAIAFVVSNRIINPLMSLRDMALNISQGKYGQTIPVVGEDEIGDLTEAFNKMSLQIKEQTKELIEREKRLQHFYEATKDGIILHDRGIPVLINQAMAVLTGYRIEELMQKSINELIAVNDTDKYLSHPDKPFSYETIAYKKNGQNFPVEVQENPIEYEGRILSSSVIRDIKDRKEAQKALNREREKRLSSFIDGQEGERERLSRELHDGLGQALIAMKMQLESIKPDDVVKTSEKVKRVKSFVINTIEDVRRMSNNLMPAVLSNFGLVDAISHLTKLIKSSTEIEINFDHNNVSKDISSKISTYLYRIIQEALNNAVKHSGASEINIMLIQEDLKLRLLIEDNGKGFDHNKLRAAGNGLYNMRERVNLLHGTIDITPSPGAGVVINIKIPLNIKADE